MDYLLKLRCPASGEPLAYFSTSAEMSSPQGMRYPVIDELPWLIPQPQLVHWQWQMNLMRYLGELEKKERDCGKVLGEVERPSTRTRVQNLMDAAQQDRQSLENLLQAVLKHQSPSPRQMSEIFGHFLPLSQSPTAYYANIHRDWAWDRMVSPEHNENMLSLQLLLKALNEVGYREGSIADMVVLGCGAGRLTYDLHQAMGVQRTLALDFNPLLLSIARNMANGGSVVLYEYPLAPVDLMSTARRSEMVGKPSLRGLHFVLADALNPPLEHGGFDLVLTPWFVDILNTPPATIFQRINSLLRPGGVWLNFGTEVFHAPNLADQLSLEECRECIESSGFKILSETFEHIPYMASPWSSHARRERVVVRLSQKNLDLACPRLHFLTPDWARETNLPVPVTEAIKSFYLSHKTYAQIAGLVDGKRSVDDIAQVMSQHFKMNMEEAKVAFLKIVMTLEQDVGRRTII